MNFISLAVSVFITNYILIYIIRLLTKKRIVPLIIISIADIGSIIGYLITFFLSGFDLVYFLYTLGNIIGIGVAYIATLMMLLENVTIFKSRRARAFERGIQNKEGTSIPRNILACICLAIAIILIVYGAINLSNYTKKLLVTTIGVLIAAVIALGLSLYFFITGRPAHHKLKAQHLLLVLQLPDETITYTATLTRDFTIEDALGDLTALYLLDEFGLIQTETKSYLVKGMKVDNLTSAITDKIHMDKIDNTFFQQALKEFNKYQRKKIVVGEQGEILKIKNIK